MKVFSLRRPEIDVDAVNNLNVSYKGVLSAHGLGGLEERPWSGFNRDQMSTVVGTGADDFAAAQAAVTEWSMFSMPWVTLTPDKPRLELGRIAVVTVRALGLLYVTNASRITLLVDEIADNQHRWGFVYATLTTHAQMGEEIFLVTHDLESDEVSYGLVAHSRPASWFAWLGYPVTRWYQRRFRRQSARAVRQAVAGAGTRGL